MKKLSIITCTYNSEKFLHDCIDSVKKQNLKKEEFEHIFVDGNSSDMTKSIISKYKEQTGYNVYIYEQSPKGVYAAMNFGVKKASGEYLLFLNSDDWLEPDILNKYIDYIKETGNSDLYFGEIYFHKGYSVRRSQISRYRIRLFKFLGLNYVIWHPTVLMKRSVLIELGLFDESKKIVSDSGLFIKLYEYGYTIKYYPKLISHFRVHEGSISTISKDLAETEKNMYRLEYLPWYKYIFGIVYENIMKMGSYIMLRFRLLRRKYL